VLKKNLSLNKDRFILLHNLMMYWITLGLHGGL